MEIYADILNQIKAFINTQIEAGNLLLLIGAGVFILALIFILIAGAIRKKRKKGSEMPLDSFEDIDEGNNEAEKKNAKKGRKNANKRNRKQTIKSTQSFSPILEVRDGVIISKDEHYYKLLEFEPINFELRSPDEQAAIIDQFSSVIRTWPDIVHMKIITAKSDITPFIESLEKNKDNELKANNECCAELIDDQINLIEKISSTQGVTRRFFVTIEYSQDSGFKRRPPFKDIVTALNREARSIAASMEACGNMLISSDDRDYIQEALYTMMCKVQADIIPYEDRKAAIIERYEKAAGGPVNYDTIPVNDFICPDRIDTSLSPKYIIIDGMYVAYCFLPASAYPVQAYGGWLQVLFGYMDDVDVDFWIKKEDITKVQRKLSFAIKSNKIKARQKDDSSQDYDEVLASMESGYYIKNALANGDDFCYISTIVTIMADSLENLNVRWEEMRNHCIRNDMQLRRCIFQQEEAYQSCLPLTSYCESIFEKSKRNIMASQLGSCYPFTAYELADKGGVFMGVNARYGTPVFLNPFDTNKYQSANMIILGPSGSGKTYSLLSMLLRMRQKGLTVYMVAPLKGHEFRRACSAIGGSYIRIAPGSNQNINIMEIRKTDRGDFALIDSDGGIDKGSILSNKIQQLLNFFTLLLPDRTEMEKQILDECIKSCYTEFGITEKNKSLIDSATGEYKKMPTLADLHRKLKAYGDKADRLYSSLTRYVSGSAKSFSMQTNVNLDNKFVVIDVSDLTAEMLPVGMFIALDYIMDASKADITKRKIIAIDECWRLMKASRQSAEFVQQVFKEIRGYGGMAVAATQDLSDVLSDEIGSAIINNARFKLMLPMDKKETEALASVIDLTTEELSQLKKTNLKAGGGGERRALLVANNNHVFVTIKASKKEHELITTNAEDLKKIAAKNAKKLEKE